ncbi:MAG: hypothetical protein P8Y15_14715 [Gemmatimonadales bacterium]
MADFFQNGVITTLQNMTQRPVGELEAEVRGPGHAADRRGAEEG